MFSLKEHAYLVLPLSLAELPYVVDPPEFCVHGVSTPLTQTGWQGRVTDMHIMCISFAHMHVPLAHRASLTKHKSKDEIITNFKVETTEH